MLTIEVLAAGCAHDKALVTDLTALVNQAYELAEKGLWLPGYARTSDVETADAITSGEVVVARSDGQTVGSVRYRRVDEETFRFSVLAINGERVGEGIGAALLEFVESAAADSGAAAMELEMLVPSISRPHTDWLASWYGRRGYVEIGRRNLLEVEPPAVPFLVAPCDASVMRKPL